MNAEDFFPMGWLDRPFRRQPYPDMTYREALCAAEIIAWNIDSEDSMGVWDELMDTEESMFQEHPHFPGRSKQLVTKLNELWRGKVTTLLKTSGGTK